MTDLPKGETPKKLGLVIDLDTCVGCHACAVACKEWNDVPADGFTFTGTSYDNTGGLGHSTWRHVKFIERTFDSRPSGRN